MNKVIQCPSCSTKFAINVSQLSGLENPRFHCSRCNTIFALLDHTTGEFELPQSEAKDSQEENQASTSPIPQKDEDAIVQSSQRDTTNVTEDELLRPSSQSTLLSADTTTSSQTHETEELNIFQNKAVESGTQLGLDLEQSSTENLIEQNDVHDEDNKLKSFAVDWPSSNPNEALEVDLSNQKGEETHVTEEIKKDVSQAARALQEILQEEPVETTSNFSKYQSVASDDSREEASDLDETQEGSSSQTTNELEVPFQNLLRESTSQNSETVEDLSETEVSTSSSSTKEFVMSEPENPLLELFSRDKRKSGEFSQPEASPKNTQSQEEDTSSQSMASGSWSLGDSERDPTRGFSMSSSGEDSESELTKDDGFSTPVSNDTLELGLDNLQNEQTTLDQIDLGPETTSDMGTDDSVSDATQHQESQTTELTSTPAIKESEKIQPSQGDLFSKDQATRQPSLQDMIKEGILPPAPQDGSVPHNRSNKHTTIMQRDSVSRMAFEDEDDALEQTSQSDFTYGNEYGKPSPGKSQPKKKKAKRKLSIPGGALQSIKRISEHVSSPDLKGTQISYMKALSVPFILMLVLFTISQFSIASVKTDSRKSLLSFLDTNRIEIAPPVGCGLHQVTAKKITLPDNTEVNLITGTLFNSSTSPIFSPRIDTRLYDENNRRVYRSIILVPNELSSSDSEEFLSQKTITELNEMQSNLVNTDEAIATKQIVPVKIIVVEPEDSQAQFFSAKLYSVQKESI